jgi:hypothetical protein
MVFGRLLVRSGHFRRPLGKKPNHRQGDRRTLANDALEPRPAERDRSHFGVRHKRSHARRSRDEGHLADDLAFSFSWGIHVVDRRHGNGSTHDVLQREGATHRFVGETRRLRRSRSARSSGAASR